MAHAHNSACYAASVTDYGVKKTSYSDTDTKGNLWCNVDNKVIDGQGGTKKYTTWFATYVPENGYTGSWVAAWSFYTYRCNTSHVVKDNIVWNTYGEKEYKYFDWECNGNCGHDLVSMTTSAAAGWTLIKCRHSVPSSLICTKDTTKSTQTNHSW